MRDIQQQAQEELERGIALLQEIENQRRGNVEGFIATDEFGRPYTQYVSETPYTRREVQPLPRSMGKAVSIPDEAFVKGRQLGKYPDPIRIIDVNSKRELHIPAEAFPEGLINPEVEVSLEKNVEFPKEQSSTIGFIRVNGVEYPIVGFESTSAGFGRNGDDVLWQEVEWDDCEGSYREPTLDSFSQLRPGYKGGNTPNLLKRCNPCSKVNPKDVAKRRAKNKAARKTKRK